MLDETKKGTVDKVQDPEVRNVLQEILDGQKKMQGCIDGITVDITDIKERTSKIEYQLTHFVK